MKVVNVSDSKRAKKATQVASEWLRSEAAKKAWDTRRKNALHKKRSDAAKKAWVTIRANKNANKTK